MKQIDIIRCVIELPSLLVRIKLPSEQWSAWLNAYDRFYSATAESQKNIVVTECQRLGVGSTKFYETMRILNEEMKVFPEKKNEEKSENSEPAKSKKVKKSQKKVKK